MIAEIIAEPEAFGDRSEALDKMTALATPEAVMDDTAFGPVPIRDAWDNTVFGTDSTFKTWVTWLADDGSVGGSLWTWTGTANNGEPFELIGINLDDYDENGLMTYSLVDWPYPAETVRAAVATGGPDSRTSIATDAPVKGTHIVRARKLVEPSRSAHEGGGTRSDRAENQSDIPLIATGT